MNHANHVKREAAVLKSVATEPTRMVILIRPKEKRLLCNVQICHGSGLKGQRKISPLILTNQMYHDALISWVTIRIVAVVLVFLILNEANLILPSKIRSRRLADF